MKKMKKIVDFRTIFGTLALALVALTLCMLTADFQSPYMLATFTPCLGFLADNIASNCDNPRIQGYEQLGVIVNYSDIDWAAVTYAAGNKRIVQTLPLLSGVKPYVVYNNKTNPLPFDGTTSVLNADNGRYDKTVQFYYEGIGGAASMNVVEPLKSGQYVMILPRKDHRGDGSFQLIGFETGLVATAQEQNEEQGYWLITMTCTEPSAEVTLFVTDYATTKAAYDALVAAA